MKEVQTDVNNAIYYINGGRSNATFSKYCTSYIFGTESQQGVDSILKYKDKTVLTVSSSGDQYLGAVYYGAGKIDIFDINRFSYYITYLKIIAILILDYQEFLNFFVPINWSTLKDTFFSLKTFDKLLPYMPDDVAYFWKNVMNAVKNKDFGNFIIPYQLNNHLDVVQRGMPFYSSETEYNKLKELLSNRKLPQFYEVDLTNLKDVLVDEYDILYLSNIIEYMVRAETLHIYGRRGNTEEESEVEKIILDKLGDNLVSAIKTNGIVLMSYRPNSNLSFSKDLLYNFAYFNVGTVSSKVLPYDDDYIEQSDVDLVLTYKPSEAGLYFKK